MLVASNFLVPNATFVVELIAFLLVLGVLGRYVLPPVNKAISARQEVIRQSLADAETGQDQGPAGGGRVQADLIEKARTEARAIVDEANKAAEALRSGGKERGEQEYARLVAQARPDIEAVGPSGGRGHPPGRVGIS